MEKRILFLSHSAQVGGAELCLLDLLKGLKGYGGLVLMPCDGPLKERIVSAGWDVLIFPLPWWVTFREKNRCHLQEVLLDLPSRLKFICSILTDRKIDLVYTNSVACLDGALAAKIRHLPHIWHIHENIGAQRDLKFYIPKFLIPSLVGCLSKKIIAPSRAVGDYFAGSRSRENKTRIVHNGVDLEQFKEDRSCRFCARVGIPVGTRVISIVGSINENKRQTDFVEAARIVANEFADVFFLVVGRGTPAYVDRISARTRQLGLTKKLRVIDVQQDVAEILASTDILVSTSLVESFGRTLVEAMATSRPVVSTRNGGAEEVVVHGVTGLLVSPGNPPELAAAVLALLENEKRAADMGRSGRKRAEELFSVERYVRDIEEILDQVL